MLCSVVLRSVLRYGIMASLTQKEVQKMDEVNQAAVSEWALGKLTKALREFREGSAPFHVVVSCFSMCE